MHKVEGKRMSKTEYDGDKGGRELAWFVLFPVSWQQLASISVSNK